MRAHAHAAHVYLCMRICLYIYVCSIALCLFGVLAYVNIAWNRPAYQTSVWGHSTANLAVDGNPDGNFYAGSCTATGMTGYPWWAVDFGTEQIVSKVKISNRLGYWCTFTSAQTRPYTCFCTRVCLHDLFYLFEETQ